MLRMAVIGCGRVGLTHAANVVRNPKAELVAVADLNQEAAAQLAAKFEDVRVETDVRQLCEADDIDAVVVAVPNSAYHDVIPVAAECGKHVLSEKPMGLTSIEARAITEACATAGVKLMVGYTMHFQAWMRRLREIITSGVLGSPVVWRHVNTNSGPGPLWFYQRDQGGGPLVDELVHLYDLSRASFGEPVAVQASLLNFSGKGDASDTGCATIHFENGDQFWTQMSWGLVTWPPGGVARNLMGPKAYLHIKHTRSGDAENPTSICELSIYRDRGEPEVITVPANDSWYEEMDAFVTCVHDDLEPSPTGINAIHALEMAEAVVRAGESGETVHLK